MVAEGSVGGQSMGFSATPEEIKAAATRVSETHMSNYAMAVSRLYKIVDNLSAAWAGTDSDTFVKVLGERRPGIAHILEVLGQYTQFMRDAAQKMEETRDGIAGAASRL